MACNFIAVKANANCKEDFSGVGSKFYVFDGTAISEDAWDLSAVNKIENFQSAIQTALAGKSLYEVDVKPKSGKVTATLNPNGGGFTNVYTGVIAKNMNDMAELARTLNNQTDWGILVPCSGGYYVLYDKDFGIEISMESDSGDAADSDHGHTVTITCGPMLYAMPKIQLTGLNFVSSGTSSDPGSATVTITGASGYAAVIKNGSDTFTSGQKAFVGSVLAVTVTNGTADNTVTWSDGYTMPGNGTRYLVVDTNGVNLSYTVA